jgi:hypothetical protein
MRKSGYERGIKMRYLMNIQVVITLFCLMGCITSFPEGTITILPQPQDEVWEGGTHHTIEWQFTGRFSHVRIEYRHGRVWHLMEASAPNTGRYLWTLPEDIYLSVVVRISSLGTREPISDTQGYRLTDKKRIFVLTPGPDDVLEAQTRQTATWNTTGRIKSVKIDVFDGEEWSPVAVSTPNDGEHNWLVPGFTTNRAKLRISTLDSEVVSESEGEFTITAGNLLVINSPVNGAGYSPGSPVNIAWRSAGGFKYIRIDFFDGENWMTVASETLNDGSFQWQLPDKAVSNAILKISGSGEGATAESYVLFEIVRE